MERDPSPYHKGRHERRARRRTLSWLPCAKGAGMHSMTEGLYGISFFFIENRLSYPLRHFVTPPLYQKGEAGLVVQHLPYHKGRHGNGTRSLPLP